MATINFDIDVQVYYGAGAAAVSLDINTWPAVDGLTATPHRVDVGESTALDLTMTDPDGDPMTFAWTAGCTGSFDDASLEDPTFILDADNGGADCVLTATISDGRGGSNTASISVATGPEIIISEGFDFVLTADDAQADDNLGHSVSIDGETAVVGAWQEDPGGISNAGAAYVFVRSGSGWVQEAKLTASDAASGDVFGYSVSISGDTAIVGAERDNGNVGAAYVFVRSGGVWSQESKLTVPDGAAGDYFGSRVSLYSDTAVVGAWMSDPGGVSGAGSAYVFVRSGGVWSQEAKLTVSGANSWDLLGASVAIYGDTIIVGTEAGEAGAVTNAGTAYVFVRSGGVWSQEAKLTASDAATGDRFGATADLYDNTAILGAWYSDPSGRLDAGSAYIFVRSGGVWTEQTKLVASDSEEGDHFGKSVAISGDTAVVSASYEDPGGITDAGSAYVFSLNGGIWTEQEKLNTEDPHLNDFFGVGASISGDTVLVGAYQAEPDGVTNAGGAYIFEGI